jgi:hypothetical protein
MRMAVNIAIVLLVALGFAVLPGGQSTLDVVLTLLTIVFFTVIALLGYRLFREHRFTIDALEPIQRAVLYSSIGLAILTFTASPRLLQGIGILVWLALLGLASYGVYWVFQRYRSYE